MKRFAVLAGLAALLFALVGAGPGANFMKHASKGFSARLVGTTTERDGGKLVMRTESMMYALGHKSRMDIDLSKTQVGEGEKKKDDAMAAFGRMYVLGDDETHLGYTVFPDRKLYMEVKAGQKKKGDQAPKSDWLMSQYTFEDQGSEAIDGHPCRKVKGTKIKAADADDDKDKDSQAYFWLAKDLDEFPVQYQPIDDDDDVTTVTFQDIKFGHVDPKLLELPADYKKGGFMDLMKGAMKRPPSGEGEDKADKVEKSDDDKDKDADKDKEKESTANKLKKKLPRFK